MATYVASNSQVKQGFRSTEVGVIPEHWEVMTLRDLCVSIADGTHNTPRYVSEGVPFYSVENVTSNNFSDTKFISLEEHNRLIRRCKPHKGDILLTRIGTLGATKLIDWDVDASIYVSLALLKVNRSSILAEYLYAYTKSTQFVRDVEKRSLLNATPKKINMGEIGSIPIPLPSPSEQRYIADVLATWDRAVALTEQLIAAAQRRKYGLMQQLLTGKNRFPAFQQRWSSATFGQVFSTKRDQNTGSRITNIITVGKYAIRPQQEHFNRIVASENLENYNVIQRGDFVYDPMSVYYGAFGRYELDKPGIVSPVYRVLHINTGYDSDFLKHLIKSHYIVHQLSANSSQGNRQGKRRTIREDAFDNIRFAIPSLGEQRAIAQVLNTCDRELSLLEQKLALLKEQKRGLMQQLFTGKVRVPA